MSLTVVDYIAQIAERYPNKSAIIAEGRIWTYAEVLNAMQTNAYLPIPLLGDDWRGNFCLVTTGSTGKPKTVMLSQDAVVANSQNLIQAHGYNEHTYFLLLGALDHLGCWSKIFPVLMTGGTIHILPDGMKNIESLFAVMDEVRAMNKDVEEEEQLHVATFLVPSNIRILLQMSRERLGDYADLIDFIETGAAAMPSEDMRQLCGLLPESRLFNTYASTETGIIASYNYNDGQCRQGCVGHALLHSHFFITESGCIACSGSTLMLGYKDNPLDTSAVQKEGVFYTTDKGYVDEDGMLYIVGREDDMINVGGYKVSPVEVEDVATAFPSVKECVCVPRPHSILGAVPCLLVVLEVGCELNKKELARFIASKLERYKVPLVYEEVPSLHYTANGKLDRKRYRQT